MRSAFLAQQNPTFRKQVCELFGAAGDAWLTNLPNLAQECFTLWSLQATGEATAHRASWIIPVQLKSGRPAILKMVPYPKAILRESRALQAMAAPILAEAIATEGRLGAVLLERIDPGTPMDQHFSLSADALATQAAAKLMAELRSNHQNVEIANFTPIETWALGFERYQREYASSGRVPFDLVNSASKLFHELMKSASTKRLLHGDLHQKNILLASPPSSTANSWKIIDPKGVVADPCFEIAAWMRNPFPELAAAPNALEILQARVDCLQTYLGYSRERLWGWSFSGAILAAIWSERSANSDCQDWLKIAAQIQLAGKAYLP